MIFPVTTFEKETPQQCLICNICHRMHGREREGVGGPIWPGEIVV